MAQWPTQNAQTTEPILRPRGEFQATRAAGGHRSRTPARTPRGPAAQSFDRAGRSLRLHSCTTTTTPPSEARVTDLSSDRVRLVASAELTARQVATSRAKVSPSEHPNRLEMSRFLKPLGHHNPRV